MRHALAGVGLAVIGGCAPANLATQGIGLLSESFAPYGIAFRRYEAPQFPYQLRALGVGQGYSVIVVTVDRDGGVLDAVGIEASDGAFIKAVLDVLPQWRFEPTESETFPRREILHYRFRLSGVVRMLTHREGAQEGFADSREDFARIRTIPWNDLDTPPARIDDEATKPPAPVQGSAELSFVIDQNGRVRVPVVLGASDSDTGVAAIAAIHRWRFSLPTQNGEHVLAEVRARWGD